MNPSKEDLLHVLHYLDGHMTERESMAFEVRLSDDPALAEACESFEFMDGLQRAVGAGSSGPRAVGKRIRGLLALAALVAVLLGVRWISHAPAPIELAVGVLPSGPTLVQHNFLLGLDETDVPAGFGLRGAEPTLTLEEYLLRVAGPEARRVETALTGPVDSVRAEAFVVPVRSNSRAFAVLAVVGEDGAVLEWFPGGDWNPQVGRLEPGRVRILPLRNMVRVSDAEGPARLEYHPGFLLPRSAQSVEIVIGVRSAPLDEALRRELNASAGGAATLQQLLVHRSFETRRLRVLRP